MPETAADPPRVKRRSDAQRDASRANGARSRGPVTAEGKAASSRNALVHGLWAAEACVLPGEDGREFARQRDRLMVAVEAVGEAQLGLAHTMCASQWRERRIEAMLNRLLAEPAEDIALLDRRFALYTRLLNQAQVAQVRASTELRRLQAHATTDREERLKSYHKGVQDEAAVAQYDIARLKRQLQAAEERLAAAGLAAPEAANRNEPGSAEMPAEPATWAAETSLDPPPSLFTPEEAVLAEAMLAEARTRPLPAWLQDEDDAPGQTVAARVTAKLRAVPEEELRPVRRWG